MKNISYLIFILVGAGLIGFGAWRQFATPQVSAADRARCESLVRAEAQGNSGVVDALLPKCADAGMVAMTDARAEGLGAQATAQRIAAANQADTKGTMINYALIGAGLALLLGGLLGRRRVA